MEKAVASSSSNGYFFRDARMVRNGCTHLAECWTVYKSLDEATAEHQHLLGNQVDLQQSQKEKEKDLQQIQKVEEAIDQLNACNFLVTWAAVVLPQFEVSSPQSYRYLFFYYFCWQKQLFRKACVCVQREYCKLVLTLTPRAALGKCISSVGLA